MKFKFNYRYLIAFLLLLGIEVLIALYVKDRFVRPFVGDMLVVMLIYTFIRSFFEGNNAKLAWGIFLFACVVEATQYFKLVEKLGLQDVEWASIVMGTTFSWIDIGAYLLGTILIIWWERRTRRKNFITIPK